MSARLPLPFIERDQRSAPTDRAQDRRAGNDRRTRERAFADFGRAALALLEGCERLDAATATAIATVAVRLGLGLGSTGLHKPRKE